MATAERQRIQVLHGHAAKGVAVRIKPTLMRLPWPVWKRLVYPIWLRWYRLAQRSGAWGLGSYKLGDHCYWRGVRLVCCTAHYCGDAADHPWDPGHGWSAERANALWEPATRRDRLLLALVGDPRRSPAPVVREEDGSDA